MTLEGLLTYFALLFAALAIMSPVQRRALGLFVPKWFVSVSILLAILLLVIRDMPLGLPPPFHWNLDSVVYGLTLGAFLIPVGAALIAWWLWSRARLTTRSMPMLDSFFEAALRDNVFDEVERVLRKNGDSLHKMPARAASVLFHPRMVKNLIQTHSTIHLELLAYRPLLEALENRLRSVEVVVREMILAGSSPIQSAVVSKYGGIEHLQFTDTERELINKTFQNPHWYHDTNAHYPLTITAVNRIESGELDEAYNTPDENYVASQGVSRRASCPIYLAIKMEVMSIAAAIEAGVEEDFYVSDLFDLSRVILDRSKAPSAVTAGLPAPYTPFAFLLENIVNGFEELADKAVQYSVKNAGTNPNQAFPGRVGIDLLQMWSFCIWHLMSEPGKIDPVLRDQLVERYFRFLFALGWEPSEVLYGPSAIQSLPLWRDAMLNEFKYHLSLPNSEHIAVLKKVFSSLDLGKRFISDGYDWLRAQIPTQFLP